MNPEKAEEIIEDTDGEIDIFVAGLGTSGTLMGVSRRLKEHNPKIKIIAVEPEKEVTIQGLKNLEVSYVPEIYNDSLIDKYEQHRQESFLRIIERAHNRVNHRG